MWAQLKNRRECALPLRDFRTIHGQNLLSNIARQASPSKNSLKHIKSFLSGIFGEAKRLDILNAVNPMQGTKLPAAPEQEDTYAYALDEIKAMLAGLPEPAWTVIQTAAWTGFRKSELRGLRWEDFDGETLSVKRTFWGGIPGEPKTRRSKAAVPVLRQLRDALEAHKLRAGILAQPGLPIFQAGNGSPLNLENLVRRVIIPALSRCAVCKKREHQHKPEAHLFVRDESLPRWHGWHAFRRGLATNLHEFGCSRQRDPSDSPPQQHGAYPKHLHQEREQVSGGRDGHAFRKARSLQRPCNES